MLTIHVQVDVGTPIDEAFAYVADLRNLPQWDPSSQCAELLGDELIGVGDRFAVDVLFRGRTTPWVYEIVEYERPSRIVLRGAGGHTSVIDEIEFRTIEHGARIDYRATFSPPPWLWPLQIFLRPAVRRLGRDVAAGLRARLGDASPASEPVEHA